MTLRGEIPEPAPLETWMAQALTRLSTVRKVCEAHPVDPANIILRIDRRNVTMLTILDTVQFHLQEEYPQALKFATDGLTVIYASNMDDHFRLTRLENAPELIDTPVQKAVAALSAHLEAVPRQGNS
jgi:hypothetical protein